MCQGQHVAAVHAFTIIEEVTRLSLIRRVLRPTERPTTHAEGLLRHSEQGTSQDRRAPPPKGYQGHQRCQPSPPCYQGWPESGKQGSVPPVLVDRRVLESAVRFVQGPRSLAAWPTKRHPLAQLLVAAEASQQDMASHRGSLCLPREVAIRGAECHECQGTHSGHSSRAGQVRRATCRRLWLCSSDLLAFSRVALNSSHHATDNPKARSVHLNHCGQMCSPGGPRPRGQSCPWTREAPPLLSAGHWRQPPCEAGAAPWVAMGALVLTRSPFSYRFSCRGTNGATLLPCPAGSLLLCGGCSAPCRVAPVPAGSRPFPWPRLTQRGAVCVLEGALP